MNNTTYHIQQWINEADAIVVGAGSGLSSACGYSHYNTVPFFTDNMQPFIEKYGFRSLFQGLTYLYSSPEEEWAYLAHYVKLMHDTPVGKPYEDLCHLLKDKPYFILTTNVDMRISCDSGEGPAIYAHSFVICLGLFRCFLVGE